MTSYTHLNLKNNIMRGAIIAIYGLLLNFNLFCQWDYGFVESTIPVIINADTLENPWTGGLTAPQWSPIDFDEDGDQDLFAFDRDGYRLLAFERTNEGWKYRPQWVEGWPELQEWCLLRDYDCDGKEDIFTGFQNGIYVYRNVTVDPDFPQFEAIATPLLANYDFVSGAELIPVVCLGLDIPAILDIDNDGDIDIISFTETSSTLYKYEGLSSCGLDMECTNRCYGMLAEASENNALFIGDEFDCSYNVVDPRDGRHAGGSLTCLQLDNQGPLDLLIGDVTYPTIISVLLDDAVNGLDSASFIDLQFPLFTGGFEALDCPRFPTGYHIDVDNDGVRDLLFSPNTYLETDDDASVYYFKNTGEDLDPVWEFETDVFLQEGMIDLGRGAYPVLIDLNNDGLTDLVISNKERYNGVGNTPSSIIIFQNTGSLEHPEFEHFQPDTIDVSTYGIESSDPALGDIDGDGDIDIIVGDEMGRLHLYINTAGEGEWPVYVISDLSISDASGETIDVGQFASPQLIDLDNDDLLDLVVGEKNGLLNVFFNCGSSSTPSWCQLITDNFAEAWGNIYVTNALGINGYSNPSLYSDENGIHILVANEIGAVQYFGLVSEDWEEEIFEVSENVLESVSGYRSGSSFSDLNNDGKVDCIMGIQNGGLRCYLGSDSANIGIPEINFNTVDILTVYPNPSASVLNWKIKNTYTTSSSIEEFQIVVRNTMGVVFIRTPSTVEGSIDTSNMAPGLYVISIEKTRSQHSQCGPPVLWVKL